MKEGDYEGAIKLFERAQFQSAASQTSPHLVTIALVSDHAPTPLYCMLIMFERCLDGNPMDLLSQFEDNYAKRCMPPVG